MKKKLFALSVLAVAGAAALTSCKSNGGEEKNLVFNYPADYSCVVAENVTGKTLNVGAILIGDRTEGYSEAHIKGIEKAKENLEAAGATVNLTYETKVKDDDTNAVKGKVQSLVGAGNNIVITNSYGHQSAFDAGQYDVSTASNVDFYSMTGDTACTKNQPNFHNAFNATYQSRFVSGYVAGLKIKELIANGEIKAANKDAQGRVKIGYVGAFPYAEVISGYTAFYLGIKAVLKTINQDAALYVKYVYSWWNHDSEKTAASALIADGCVIVSQHADSTGTAEACEEKFNQGTTVYNIGYNISFIEDAPSCSLTSATNDWSVFYTEAFYKKLAGVALGRDWSAGYEKGAVGITEINYDCFDGDEEDIEASVAEVAKKLHNKEMYVFDCSTFTVGGQHLTNYTITDNYSTVIGTQCIKQNGSTYYFDESNVEVRSAPYFDIIVDGVTVVA